jgi:ribosomal protein S1
MTDESLPTPAEVSADESPMQAGAGQNAPASKPGIKPIADLRPKMKLTGKVKRVELQGAIIDVGMDKDGLLHISQLSTETVKNVTDVVNLGDEITVYVLAVDSKSGRLDLTMVPPPDLTWNEVKVNQVYQGTVERIESYGVFVNIGAERPGLIHISELARGYVSDPHEVVKVGDTIEAKVIGINKRKKQIDLSVRALEAEEAVVEEEGEPEVFMTAMEVALRRALEGAEGGSTALRKSSNKRRDKKKPTNQQDDIIARTLRLHQENK